MANDGKTNTSAAAADADAEKNIPVSGGPGSAAAEGAGAGAEGTVAAADLQEQLTRAHQDVTDLLGKIDLIAPAMKAMGLNVDESETAPSHVDQLIDAAGALAAERDALKVAAAKAAKAPKAAAKPRSTKLRAIAAPKDRPDADAQKAIFERLSAGGEGLELVATDGKHEIAGLDPTVISGDAFQAIGGDKMKLTLPIDYKPGSRVTVAGFALFDEDGKLVAYSALPDPQPIEAGHSMRFQDAIVF